MKNLGRALLCTILLQLGCGDDDAGADASMDGAPRDGDVTMDASTDASMDMGPSSPFPPPEQLEELAEPPALLQTQDGVAVGASEWPARREEMLALFAQYVYGVAPPLEEIRTEASVRESSLDGAEYEEVQVSAGPITLHLALFRPPGSEPTPVILALNKCGNQSISEDTRVRLTTSVVVPECLAETAEETVGIRSESWPIADIVARGYTLATFHESDVRQDVITDAGPSAMLTPDAPEDRRWGAIAQWAWGLRHAVSYLETDARIDASRIVLTGHSRRGKAALWAAAQDERVAVVVPHQSGRMGASITRSDVGEPLSSFGIFFPHWFSEVFHRFASQRERLPVDQHQLLALVAPRSVLSSNGAADEWADPMGALEAAQLADPAWELLGEEGLVLEGEEPVFDAALSWFSRPGGHSLDAEDWTLFLDYADARFANR